MNRERKILFALILFAIPGWIVAAALATSVGSSNSRAVSAEREASRWKHQAGRAYTQLLKARSGGDATKMVIPAGTLIECSFGTSVADGKTVSLCEDGIIYPPLNY